MSKDPSFLFYSSDFLTGCLLMSFEERGKYITILSFMHQKGRMLAEEIEVLVGKLTPHLKSKFQIDENGLFYNVRLETEIERRQQFSQSRRQNGLRGGRPTNKTITPPIKKIKIEKEKEVKIYYADNVSIKAIDYNKLLDEFGKIDTDWMVNKLSGYKLSSGKEYKSDYGAIRNWVTDELLKIKSNHKTNGQQGQQGQANINTDLMQKLDRIARKK